MQECLQENYTMPDKVIIIAEAGVNHNGDLELAKKLVDVAAEAGADFVKFQTFKAANIAAKTAKKAAYQQAATGTGESQVQMLKKLELGPDDHLQLIEYCKNRNIRFLSTPFDLESIDLLKALGITIGKIPSGEITNLPYLRKMADSFKTIILSTGMSDISEVKDALGILYRQGVAPENIIVLHCNTEYPTPFSDVNLKAMTMMKDELQVRVGYSDHTQGIEVPVAATALGAVLIEKHFTLDKEMEGPDHKASLEPAELVAMVKAIRNIEQALGKEQKTASASEIKNKSIARKSIVAAARISKGEIFTEKNLTTKRPGTGLNPMKWDEVIGTAAIRDFEEDELIDI